MGKSCEELYIGKIESGIRGIRFGTKEPKDVKVEMWLEKLKPLNQNMYEELSEKFSEVMLKFELSH